MIGWEDDVLRLRVTAPPIEGRANAAVLRLLARALDMPVSRLQIVKGESSRHKTVRVEGLSEEDVRRTLGETRPNGSRSAGG